MLGRLPGGHASTLTPGPHPLALDPLDVRVWSQQQASIRERARASEGRLPHTKLLGGDDMPAMCRPGQLDASRNANACLLAA